MKVLNLYAGIGGNRKLWTDVKVTAVENNKSIAAIYQDFFPEDKMIIIDAHQYLLDHFKEFDFIWSSPPCPTHSRLRLLSVNRGLIDVEYPDMNLYQEIILLKNLFKGEYCIENVNSYYKPLIEPQESGRHYFWSNFYIPKIKINHISIKNRNDIKVNDRMKDINIFVRSWHGYKDDKQRLLKNCVYPELGLHILECARGNYNYLKQNQQKLW